MPPSDPRGCAHALDATRNNAVVREKTKTRRNSRDSMAFCPPQKVNRSGLGRSPGSEVQTVRSAAASTFPGKYAEWLYEASVLTHSGGTAPDSHRTSLLCPSWAPRQGRDLYHGLGGRSHRLELLETVWAETIDVAFLQSGERSLVELDVAAPAAEQPATVERDATFRTAFFFFEHPGSRRGSDRGQTASGNRGGLTPV